MKTTPQPKQRRGEIQVTIGEQVRTLKFGMNTLAAFGQLHFDSPGDFSEQFSKNPIGALVDMTYCALLARKPENDLPADFSPVMVGDWIDEMEQADWELVQATMMGAMAPGNPSPAILTAAPQQ